MPNEVTFKKLDPRAIIPKYAHMGDSGFDFHALDDITIWPGETKLVHTGLAMEMPEGLEMQIRPRSGMSLKTPLLIQNTPGTVDSGYRGEICIICHCLYTNNLRPIEIKAGDRVAQGVMARVTHVAINEAEAISTSDRGENGLGSTGK